MILLPGDERRPTFTDRHADFPVAILPGGDGLAPRNRYLVIGSERVWIAGDHSVADGANHPVSIIVASVYDAAAVMAALRRIQDRLVQQL